MYPTPILLAISGGIDSMVMLHRMVAEYGVENLTVAHCNFQLRAGDSNLDEAFVQAASKEYGLKCFTERFDTLTYAVTQGLSTQESARDLRYEFFFRLKDIHGLGSIATAHHLDDSIETFFINLLRGSGPRGLSGISDDPERGIIRPLMDMDRKAIQAYAETHDIEWREDSSNASDKYLRNRLRHEVLPILREIKPGFDKVMRRNMDLQAGMEDIFLKVVGEYEVAHLSQDGNTIQMDIPIDKTDVLLASSILSKYGFNSVQVADLAQSQESGRQVMSDGHVLTKHKDKWLLTERKKEVRGMWRVAEGLQCGHLPIGLSMEMLTDTPRSLHQGDEVALFDTDQLHFPMKVRRWKPGDSMVPLGMRGRKKISDLLTDRGLSIEEKKNVFVLISGEDIIWLIGHRIHDGYKLSGESKAVLRVEFDPTFVAP